MTDVFGLYSDYYDLLYQDKDYQGEAAFVSRLLLDADPSAKFLLEFGCGTGVHAELLAGFGFHVIGVERSETMLKQAHERATRISGSDCKGSFCAFPGDARAFRSEASFDAVLSLFHVVSYQTEQPALEAFFENAARHLKVGGVFLFDVWYGPAVLTERPAVRVKRMANERLKVVRLAEPDVIANQNLVQVKYQIFARVSGTENYQAFEETHSMRYFFAPEILLLAEKFGMSLISSQEWLTQAELSDRTWGACFLLRKN
jgi:SAM-dependent methyltransferase